MSNRLDHIRLPNIFCVSDRTLGAGSAGTLPGMFFALRSSVTWGKKPTCVNNNNSNNTHL